MNSKMRTVEKSVETMTLLQVFLKSGRSASRNQR